MSCKEKMMGISMLYYYLQNVTIIVTDIALAHVEQEKRLSFIKAWEESEQTKAINK